MKKTTNKNIKTTSYHIFGIFTILAKVPIPAPAVKIRIKTVRANPYLIFNFPISNFLSSISFCRLSIHFNFYQLFNLFNISLFHRNE